MKTLVKNYIETPRLVLRGWKEEDISWLKKLNSNDRVMEYFLKKLSDEETEDFYRRIQCEFATCGYGLYAVEKREDRSFVGYVGLHGVTFEVDFAPAVEIGWRLFPEFWNMGYATEAASACLDYACRELGMKEICSFTSLPNKASQRVMQKIGMERVKEFDHPLVSPDHPLCRHVLYRKKF